MNFLKYKFLYLFISITLIISSITFLLLWGLRPSVDFTGGTLIELQFENRPEQSTLNKELNNIGIITSTIQYSEDNQAIIKSQNIPQEQTNEKITQLEKNLEQTLTVQRIESVGPTLGRELLIKTVYAIIITSILILTYIAWSFQNWLYGLCAIIAMVHDVLILFGSFSLFGHLYGVEVDTLFITALLITLSFSVHDTVIVYDRLREASKQFPKVDFYHLANKAITETMARSLNNSLTTAFMLLALMLLGGSSLYWFTVALLIGIVIGTYSSPFVSLPLLLFFKKRTVD